MPNLNFAKVQLETALAVANMIAEDRIYPNTFV